MAIINGSAIVRVNKDILYTILVKDSVRSLMEPAVPVIEVAEVEDGGLMFLRIFGEGYDCYINHAQIINLTIRETPEE
jgi:hypothetical protein